MKQVIHLFAVLLLCPIASDAQTTFYEDASGKNIDLDGRKDGGFTFADFNEDGYLDLLVNTASNDLSHRSRLYFSQGPPDYEFMDVTSVNAMGLIRPPSLERCAVAGDLNNDGYTDFVINTARRFELYLNNGPLYGYTFGDVNQDPNFFLFTDNVNDDDPPNGIPAGMNTEGIGLLDYDNDGDLDIMIENHNWGIDIYRNNTIPNGVFSLTHMTPGDNTVIGLPQKAVDGDYASVTDFDDDGYVDIVARKRTMEDFFRNNGDGTFSIVTSFDQEASNNNKGAVSLYDFDNDGDYDLFWTDNGTNQIWQQQGIGTGVFVATGEPFLSAGVNNPNNRIDGLACGDVDNDGDIDIFLGSNNQESYLFLNETPPGSDELIFERNNCEIDVDENAEGCSFVDFDRDGDLDLYVNIHNDDNQLWINDLQRRQRRDHLFVRIFENLEQSIPDRDALGANVILKDCEGNVISGIREVNGGNGHGTQDVSFVHFGLPFGPDEEYIVEVHYPFYNNNRKIAQYRVTPSSLGNYHLLEVRPQDILDSPITVNDYGSQSINSTKDYDVLSNDLLANPEPVFLNSIVAQPSNGTAQIISSNNIEYENVNEEGSFEVIYEICFEDCVDLCSFGSLFIDVSANCKFIYSNAFIRYNSK